MSDASSAEPIATPTPDNEVRRLMYHLSLLKEIIGLVHASIERGDGDKKPEWARQNIKSNLTNIDVAQQIVQSYLQCDYIDLIQGELAFETVRWRENFRWMFSKGPEIAKRHGQESAMRLISAMPPPHDETIVQRAKELMREVLVDGKRPLEAAKDLTRLFIKVRRNRAVTKSFLREDADDQIGPEKTNSLKHRRPDKNQTDRVSPPLQDEFVYQVDTIEHCLNEILSESMRSGQDAKLIND